MKKTLFITLGCLLIIAGCLEIKNSVFDTETDLSKNWNARFSIPTYNLPGGDVVRFALFTDSHQNYQDLNATINIINKSSAQFAVCLGDFTDVGTRDEYEIFHAFLRDLEIPSWIVPGNHDLANVKDKLLHRVFGASNTSIVTSFGKMIFWNSNALELLPNGADINWLDQEVSSASVTEPVFIFQHQDPLNSLTFTSAEISRISSILTSHPQVFVFHGHLHSFSRAQIGTAEIFQIGRVEGRQLGYVEIDNTDIRVIYCSKHGCNKVYENAVIFSPASRSTAR